MLQIRDSTFEVGARPAQGFVRGGKLIDGSSISCGCRRADPDVRQAARMTMPAWGAWLIAAQPTARCAVGGGQATAGRERPAARRRRRVRRCASTLVDGFSVSCRCRRGGAGESLPGATAGRQADPSCRFSRGVPARWAMGLRFH